MDDSRIVDLYLLRDEEAIRKTVAKYGSRLCALAHSIVCDRQVAEECENDTYMEAWNSIPPHEPRTYLFAFLARIARHLSLNFCRDRGRLKRSAFLCELSTDLEQCIPAPDDAQCRIDDIAFQEMLNAFLGTLSDKKRNIFIRRYWYLDSVADISMRFGLSESSVKTTLFRCRKKLREHLEKGGYTI